MTSKITKDNRYIIATDVAKATGLTRAGVAYYEELGLIKPLFKAGKYSVYAPETIDRVKKINKLKENHKLAYIKELLDGEGGS